MTNTAVPRPKCSHEGCTLSVRNKGRTPNGEVRYDSVCQFHHKRDRKDVKLDNKVPCEVCGWNADLLAFCDRHRPDPNARYSVETVIMLCPNCHRLETIGVIHVERKDGKLVVTRPEAPTEAAQELPSVLPRTKAEKSGRTPRARASAKEGSSWVFGNHALWPGRR